MADTVVGLSGAWSVVSWNRPGRVAGAPRSARLVPAAVQLRLADGVCPSTGLLGAPFACSGRVGAGGVDGNGRGAGLSPQRSTAIRAARAALAAGGPAVWSHRVSEKAFPLCLPL